MKRTKAYPCVQLTILPDKNLRIHLIGHVDRFCKQVQRWIRERGYANAERRFVLNYLPDFRVLEPQDIGALTDGLIIAHVDKEGRQTVYWDESYQLKSFLSALLETGTAYLCNQGELEKE